MTRSSDQLASDAHAEKSVRVALRYGPPRKSSPCSTAPAPRFTEAGHKQHV